jgi:superfamily II DNA or RNA helicase
MNEDSDDVVDTQDQKGNEEEDLYGTCVIRWYQRAACNGVEIALERGDTRVLIVLPTGAGKTLTAGLVFSSDRIRAVLGVHDRPLNLLFLSHRHRLLTQAERTFADASNINFIPHSVFQPIPTDVEWDLCCIDEAHHEAMFSIQLQLERLSNKPILGLTATPDRADGCLIKFEEIINPITREEAVEQGYLAPTYLNTIVDTPHKDKVPVLKQILDRYSHEMGQTMVFVRTKKEVNTITEHLQNLGYAATAIIGQTNRQLDELLDSFSHGEVQFLINCNKINEGIDVKGCTDVIIARNIGSYPQLNQVIGRASRPDSDCVVWEFVNPLSGDNLETTCVVGRPERHRLISKKGGEWIEQEFDYVSHNQVFEPNPHMIRH